jgi:hypothetical protein
MELFDDFELDIETMGTAPGCVVSVGLVGFDVANDFVGVPEHWVLNVHDQVRAGLGINADTLRWWTGQSPEAQTTLFQALASPDPTDKVLLQISEWLQRHRRTDKFSIWGNGASFDQPILARVFAAMGVPLPWKFYMERCHRTLKGLPDTLGMDKIDVVANACAHNAAADAEFQARQAVAVLRTLAGQPSVYVNAPAHLPETPAEPVMVPAGFPMTKLAEELRDGALR